MGYPVRSYVTNDAPRAFKYINRHGKTVYTGYSFKVVLALLEKHNGTFVEIFYNKTKIVDGSVQHRMLVDREIDIAVHPYVLMGGILSVSYPITPIDVCVVVPAPQEIPASLYNVLPFDRTVWFTIFGSILIFFFVHLMVKVTSGKPINYVEDIIGSVGIIIAMTPEIEIYTRSWQNRIIFVFVAAYGLILVSLYHSTLTSLYTIKIYGKGMETLEDIMKANISIMVLDTEWMPLRNAVEPENFQKQFIPTEETVFIGHRNYFNTSFGYVSASDRMEWLLEQQTYFERPLFSPPIYCFIPTCLRIGMSPLSPYEEALDRVILQTFQTGLRDKWLKETFDDTVYAGIVKRMIVSRSKYKPLVLENLEYFWIFWAFGMILSMISFIVETSLTGHLVHDM
ncbi:uncharacterized protein LOC119646306 [Hermetia illucens]|uniref:uncharacterized protein LOC119646306 n=1 Tax=Hermetia illucens TaxID=343691 RepID=UPI0018CC6144|nr:uncharacterized protein LOC119646306 [Hermetia illucens]